MMFRELDFAATFATDAKAQAAGRASPSQVATGVLLPRGHSALTDSNFRNISEIAMNSYRKTLLAVIAMALTLFLSLPAHAQGPVERGRDHAAEPQTTPAPPAPLPPTLSRRHRRQWTDTPDGWRGQIAIYGWFPGIHGTVGVLGHDAGIHVPFSDVFHTLKGIIPIAVELDKGRLVIPVDFFWVKLGDDKGHSV